MAKISADDGLSAHRDLADRIWRSEIEGGFGPMHKFPGDRELSERYQVGLAAVRTAMSLLEADGLVNRIPRSGTFVRSPELAVRSHSEPFQCINFIKGQPNHVALRFQMADYNAGYTQALESHNIKTRYLVCPPDFTDYPSLFWKPCPMREQGCVLVAIRHAGLIRWLREQGVPFIVQGYFLYDASGLPEHGRVCVNKAGGAFLAVRHLIELGHRRIGYIGEPAVPRLHRPNPTFQGFWAAMVAAGLDVHPDHTMENNTNDPLAALEPARQFLTRPDRPTALLTHNDAIAMATLAAAKSLGIRVPEDLSVVGYNDQPDADATDPPLTTVRSPRSEVARLAVETLLEAAKRGETPTGTKTLDCELVVRASTGPPPAQ